MGSLGRVSSKYHEKAAGTRGKGISSKVRRLVKRRPVTTRPAESHLDNKMQLRGDKTRLVCSRGRSRTLRVHVNVDSPVAAASATPVVRE